MEKIMYTYEAIEYSRKKYTSGSATVEKGTAYLPDFKSKDECESYLDDLAVRGCAPPFCALGWLMSIKMVKNGFDVHTYNSHVVQYRKVLK